MVKDAHHEYFHREFAIYLEHILLYTWKLFAILTKALAILFVAIILVQEEKKVYFHPRNDIFTKNLLLTPKVKNMHSNQDTLYFQFLWPDYYFPKLT